MSRHGRVRWLELVMCATALWVSLWSGLRVWLSLPKREVRESQLCHCICPECPECPEVPM